MRFAIIGAGPIGADVGMAGEAGGPMAPTPAIAARV